MNWPYIANQLKPFIMKYVSVAASGGSYAVSPHDIVGTDHSVTGSAFDVVGLSTTNTLDLLTPSNAPGAAQSLLVTTTSGQLTIEKLTMTSGTVVASSGAFTGDLAAGSLTVTPGASIFQGNVAIGTSSAAAYPLVITSTATYQLGIRAGVSTAETWMAQTTDGYLVLYPDAKGVMINAKLAGNALGVYSTGTFSAQFYSTQTNVMRIMGASGAERSIRFMDAVSGAEAWKVGLDNAPAGNVTDFTIKSSDNAVPDFVITTGSRIGVNVASPGARLDSLSATGPQLRLTYSSGAMYADMQVSSSGLLSIDPILSATFTSSLNVGSTAAPSYGIHARTDVGLSSAIGSTGFVAQSAGWRATYPGHLDVRSLYCDELHTKAFIADLEQALAGGQVIVKSVSRVWGSTSASTGVFTVPSSAGGSTTLAVEELAGFTGQVFTTGDILGIRSFTRTAGNALTVSNAWLQVDSYSTRVAAANPPYQIYTVSRTTAYPGATTGGTAIAAGTLALDYGSTASNGMYEVNVGTQTVDGTALYGPMLRISEWSSSHPGAGFSERVRIGNMRGAFGFTTTEYGLGVGDYSTSTGNYMRYGTSTGFAIKLGQGALQLDSSGLTIYATTGTAIWPNASLNFANSTERIVQYITAGCTTAIAWSDYRLIAPSTGAMAEAELTLGAAISTASTDRSYIDILVPGSITFSPRSVLSLTVSTNAVYTSHNFEAARGTFSSSLYADNSTGYPVTANRYYWVSLSSDKVLTTGAATMVTLTTALPAGTYFVTGTFDFDVQAGAGADAYAIGELNIGTATYTPWAILLAANGGHTRATASQSWIVTKTTVGPLSLDARKIGTGTVSAANSHTGGLAVRLY